MSHQDSRGLTGVILGTVIGAGFASGREIVTFFTDKGPGGLYALALSGLLWVPALYALLYVLRRDRIRSCPQLTDILFGHEIRRFFQPLVAVFLFIGLCVMASGSGALLYQAYGLPRILGSALLLLAVALTLPFGPNGLRLIGRLLAPLLIIGILFAGLLTLHNSALFVATLTPEPVATLTPSLFFGSAPVGLLLYVSYNLLGLAAVLPGLIVRRPFRTALLAGGLLALLSFVLGLATFLNYGTIKAVEIPILSLLAGWPGLRRVYTGILLLAMYTTAVSDAYGCRNLLGTLRRVSGRSASALLLLFALLLSETGFTVLIRRGYTFFGCVGLFLLLRLFMRAVTIRRTKL